MRSCGEVSCFKVVRDRLWGGDVGRLGSNPGTLGVEGGVRSQSLPLEQAGEGVQEP